MVTFEQYNNTVNEGWVWELVKFADPTGITSIPDLIEAFNNYFQNRTFLKLVWLILCIVAVLPVAKYAGKGLSKALKPLLFGAKTGSTAAKATAATAKNIAQAETQLAKTVDLLLKGETTVSKALTKLNLPQQNVSSLFADLKAFKQNPSLQTAAKSAITAGKGAVKETGKQAQELLQTTFASPGLMKAGYYARGAKGLTGAGVAGAEAINKGLDPYNAGPGGRLSTAPRQAPVQASLPIAQAAAGTQEYDTAEKEGEELVYQYTDPQTGQTVYGTEAELQSIGAAPIQQPQQQTYPLAGTNIQMTPAQQQAIGGFIPRGGTQRTGQIIPQNVPQGATQQNPFGREVMSPSQYMTPDNFNNPPYNQYQNQPYNPVNAIGDIGSTVANTLGGVGALAGQLAATPVAGITNLASSLLGLIPGMNNMQGMGSVNPYQMAPAGYNPYGQYYRSPAGYNPYNYSPYGYPQR